MLRKLALIGLIPLLFAAAPASAATKEQKMETCKFGADNDKLTGKKRDAYIKKCMSNANYEPKARLDALKKTKKTKKPAAKKTTTKKPAAKKPAAATTAPAPAPAPTPAPAPAPTGPNAFPPAPGPAPAPAPAPEPPK